MPRRLEGTEACERASRTRQPHEFHARAGAVRRPGVVFFRPTTHRPVRHIDRSRSKYMNVSGLVESQIRLGCRPSGTGAGAH